jgi:hypothetical protein
MRNLVFYGRASGDLTEPAVTQVSISIVLRWLRGFIVAMFSKPSEPNRIKSITTAYAHIISKVKELPNVPSHISQLIDSLPVSPQHWLSN